ncbi:hypothetical protein V1264_016287 [Littorina saxatilis]|uniref:Glycoside hydrolase family 3 C-terminal domain-containing protein n=1 Tax=Littorina saxatilis TaxID=31220 RepID=A0AAN9BRX8_9CAEN
MYVHYTQSLSGQSVEAEGRDRPDTELPGHQKTLLQDVINNTPSTSSIVLILFNAGPVNITFADTNPKVAAILECFFPAQAAGEALQHVILNDVDNASPAGRLPFTWPMFASQIPPMVNYSMQGRTYRYFDGDPLYPFGYGLSYTSFDYSELWFEDHIQAGDSLKGYVYIGNRGDQTQDEV